MVRMLIDTCVWLDIAKDPKQHALIGVIQQMVKQGYLSLIVPEVVLEEFFANRERIEAESAKSLSTHFRLVKEAIGKAGGSARKTRAVLSHLDDVNHKIPIIGGSAVQALDRIDRMLNEALTVPPSEAVKLASYQRAKDRRAPFRRGKNAMADAVIIETYAECVRAGAQVKGERFAFVTHNKADFSWEGVNEKQPHIDYLCFKGAKSRFFISLPEALHRVEPSLVSEIMFEESFLEEPRGLTEIQKAQDLLFHQVWYNRHWNLRVQIEKGEVQLVDKETYPRPRGGPETVQKDVWKGALVAARRVEKKYGKRNLGPWDDFEWGMVNGKLSALRWVLGDEWDFLDT